jgi:hypothetical protein
MPLVLLERSGAMLADVIRYELVFMSVQVSLDDCAYRCQEVILGPFCPLMAIVSLFLMGSRLTSTSNSHSVHVRSRGASIGSCVLII